MTNGEYVMVAALAIASLFGYWYYRVQKSGQKFGKVLTLKTATESETIMDLILISLYLGEAIVAATVHKEGINPGNEIGRFFLHFGTIVLGASCSISWVRDVGSIFVKGIGGASMAWRFFVSVLVLIGAFSIPLLNIFMIAGNLGQDGEFHVVMAGMFPFSMFYSHADVMMLKMSYHLDLNSAVWPILQPPVKVGIVTIFVHYLGTFILGGRNMATKDRRNELFKEDIFDENKKKDEKKDDKKQDDDYEKMPGEDRALAKATSNLKFLFQRLGYSGPEADKRADQAYKILLDTKINNNAAQAKLSVKILNFVNDARTLDNKKFDSQDEKREAKKKLVKEIAEFFAASPKNDNLDKRGFGIDTKK